MLLLREKIPIYKKTGEESVFYLIITIKLSVIPFIMELFPGLGDAFYGYLTADWLRIVHI